MKTSEKSIRTIATFGSGDGAPGEPMYDEMFRVGQILANSGVTVFTGGYAGAGMEAAARGAKQNRGKVIGFTLLDKKGNEYLTQEVQWAKYAKKLYKLLPKWLTVLLRPGVDFIADFCLRLAALLSADGYIVAAGGGAGTMIEFFGAVQFNRRFWLKKGDGKRIAILKPDAVTTPGYDSQMINTFMQYGVLGDAGEGVEDLIVCVHTAVAAVEWVTGGEIPRPI